MNQYDKVIFVDLDVVIVRPLSYIAELLTDSKELVGYRTCTAPVNSGFFVVRPKGHNGKQRLKHLNDITLRNRCPCRSRQEPFASSGFDNWGEITLELRNLWRGAYDAPSRPRHDNLCRGILERKQKTWNHAGAGTGQGLMWYYFGLKLNSYVSLTYSDLPLVHYNAPGPKPWATNTVTQSRQHCDFVWWKNFLEAESKLPPPVFDTCRGFFSPHINVKRRNFSLPSCCRACPGGGHFETPKACVDTGGLKPFLKFDCAVTAELRSAL